MLSVAKSFVSQCSWCNVVCGDAEGRVLMFMSDSAKGSLDIFSVYFDAQNPYARIEQIKIIIKLRRPGAHTIILGDLNMAFHRFDRITDSGAPSELHIGPDVEFWNQHLGTFSEFEQPMHTCKYSGSPGGMSKLERVFTSLQTIEFSMLGTACNLLGIHHELSDHFPVSARFFQRARLRGAIQPWITETDCYEETLNEALRNKGLDIDKPVEVLMQEVLSNKFNSHLNSQDDMCRLNKCIDEVQGCMYQAAHETAKSSKALTPKTTMHKLAVCAGIFKALYTGDSKLFEKLVFHFPQFADMPIVGYRDSPIFPLFTAYHTQLVQQLSLERAQKEAQKRENKDREILEFGGLGSSYATLYNLKPAGFNTISALQVSGSEFTPPHDQPFVPEFTTDPCKIAEGLNEHWSQKFSHKPHDVRECEFFADKVRGLLACDLDQVRPVACDVAAVLENVHDSGVGPDLLPYSAYLPCFNLSVAMILVMINCLLFDESPIDMSLLLAFLAFLPKKSFSMTPCGLKLYKAENTRPLSLSNTFIKLVLTSFKVCLARCVNPRMHKFQKCIAGRSLLDNVILLDSMMHQFAITHGDTSGALFWDFVAAFPSVAHGYLWSILEAVGLPWQLIRAIRKCYVNNKHLIKLDGRVFDGPSILAGVRQGCPLSMLLFAIAVWPLLICLEHLKGNDDAIGGFADDIGAVFRELREKLPALFELFLRFARASCLDLNLAKCVCVPLSSENDVIARFKAMFDDVVPGWSGFTISSSAEYLGFILGPGAVGVQWTKVLKKASDTVCKWQSLKLGFFYNVLACNVFILSLFSYIGQLAVADEEISRFLDWMSNRLFQGPGHWLPTGFLVDMKTLGFPVQLRDLEASMTASKIRVCCNTDLDLDTLHTDTALHIIKQKSVHGTRHPHYKWHKEALVNNIVLARRNFRIDLNGQSVIDKFAQEGEGKCKGLQAAILTHMRECTSSLRSARIINRIRVRMERWDFAELTIGRAHRRAINRLQSLEGKCKPMLWITYLKALINSWPTFRRMKSAAACNLLNICPFCDRASDSIEHFIYCPVCREQFAVRGLTHGKPIHFFALDSACAELPALLSKVFVLGKLFAVRGAIVAHPKHLPPLDVQVLFRATNL